jgi:hypothetical protein
MGELDVVTLDIMKVVAQLNLDVDKYITWSRNNPSDSSELISENAQHE